MIYFKHISDKQILESLQNTRTRNGISKYMEIQKQYQAGSITETFFDLWKRFYGMTGFHYPGPNNPAVDAVKSVLLDIRQGNIDMDIRKTLVTIYRSCGRYELSYTTKIFATEDPHRPVYDSRVAKVLKLPRPSVNKTKKLQSLTRIYRELVDKTGDLVNSSEGERILSLFDQVYPERDLTDIKKLDFCLWSVGRII